MSDLTTAPATDGTSPATAAGRRLLPWLAGHFFEGRTPAEAWDKATADIIAIETEAATSAGPEEPGLERLREIERRAKWLTDIWADNIAIGRGTALWEDITALRAALHREPPR